jgi:hypothetical protein
VSSGHDDLRDEAVARAWREHVRDEPSAAIDDAIRAAARRAVDAKPAVARKVAEAREPWRWWMPLAAAATIGAVAIGVLQNMPQDAGEPTVVSDMTSARPAAPKAAPPMQEAAPAPMQEAVPQKKVAPPASAPEARDRTPLPMPRLQASKPDAAPKRADAPSESKETFVAPPPPADARQVEAGADKLKQEQQVGALEKRAQATEDLRRNERDAPSGFVASPPPAAAPASAPPPSLAGAAAPARESKDAVDAIEPESRAKLRAAAPAAPAAQVATGGRASSASEAMAVTPPATFVATIRRLLAAGDREGAARELQRFRRTHADADARLPDDLKAFAASVPR